jgi:hypothetical protein
MAIVDTSCRNTPMVVVIQLAHQIIFVFATLNRPENSSRNICFLLYFWTLAYNFNKLFCSLSAHEALKSLFETLSSNYFYLSLIFCTYQISFHCIWMLRYYFFVFISLLLIARNIINTLFFGFINPIDPKNCKESIKSKEKVGNLGWKRVFHFFKLL